jgi:hypothetical protein
VSFLPPSFLLPPSSPHLHERLRVLRDTIIVGLDVAVHAFIPARALQLLHATRAEVKVPVVVAVLAPCADIVRSE